MTNEELKQKLQEAWDACIQLQKDLTPRLPLSLDREVLDKAINKIALKISEVKNEL